MTNLKFEGETEGIAPRQLDFILETFNKLRYNKETIKVSTVGKAGDGYSVENLKRLTVEKNGKFFKIVAKFAPTDEQKRNLICIDKIFFNEHLMFTEVLPAFTELENRAGVPDKERFRYANCYGTLTEKPYETILLEDLQVEEFIMLDKTKFLSEECVKMVLKSLAALHAASFTFKVREPEKFDNFKNQLFNVYENIEKLQQVKKYFEVVESDSLKILQEEKYVKVVSGIASNYFSIYNSLKTEDGTYYTLVHGDCHIKNMMFRQKNGKSTVCCLVDYQCVRIISPVIDTVYTIFTSTDYEMRKIHFHEWMDYYHSELSKYLSYYELNVKDVYPKEQLDKDLRKYVKANLFMAIVGASVSERDDADAEKFKAVIQDKASEDTFDENSVLNMNPATISRFKTRVEGLINSCYELGLIDE